MEHAILTENISKSFSGRQVLSGIDLHIEKGEIFGLLGPSGAGKTTLIRLLTGQIPSDSGISYIQGKPSHSLTGEDSKRFGILMDNFGVYERLSCYDNLKVFAQIYGIKKEKIYQALDGVGLLDWAKKPAGALSKGMKSRLRLARVFLIDPDILFLDEPTSGLDPATAEDIQRLILAQKAQGKTIFLTTHTMTEAEKLCDHIALLNEGKIVEYGSPQEICRRYNHRRKIQLHLTDGSDLELSHAASAGDTIRELLENGTLETIHSTEPSLEWVFMTITGRELCQ